MCRYYDCTGNFRIERNFSPDIINPFGSDEPCVSNWNLDSPSLLPKPTAGPYRSSALVQQPIPTDEDITVSIQLGGTSLVDVSRNPDLQWPAITDISDRDHCLNRCVFTGLGGNVAGNNNRRSMVTRRSIGTYQSSRTESFLSGAISFIQVVHSSTTTCSSPDGQLHSCSIREQERGYSLSHLVDTSHRPLGSGPESWFLGNSRTHLRYIEPHSRHSISSFRQSLRMDASPRCLSEDYPPVLSACSGPLCKPSQQPASPVRVSVPRPRSNGNGCIPLQLEPVEELDFSSGSVDPEDPKQAQSGQSYRSRPGPPLERTAMVSYTAGDVRGLPEATPSTTGTNQSPLRSRERTPSPAQATPDRVAIIREGFRAGSLSQAATDILLSSWSEATQ